MEHRPSGVLIVANMRSHLYMVLSKFIISPWTIIINVARVFCYCFLLENWLSSFQGMKIIMNHIVFSFSPWLWGDSKVSIMSNHRNYDRLVFCVVYTLFLKWVMLILNLIQSELPYQKKKNQTGFIWSRRYGKR